jgi:hypothetical protein
LLLHSACAKIAAFYFALRFLASPQHNQLNLLLRSACAKIAAIVSKTQRLSVESGAKVRLLL